MDYKPVEKIPESVPLPLVVGYMQLIAYANDGREPSRELLDDIKGYEMMFADIQLAKSYQEKKRDNWKLRPRSVLGGKKMLSLLACLKKKFVKS